MSLNKTRKWTARVLGLPLTAEVFIQNILLLGFFVLLLLVAGIGYWTWESFNRVNEDLSSINQSEVMHLGIVLRLGEKAGIMWNEARNMLAYDEEDRLYKASKRKLSDLKKEIDDLIKRAHVTELANTPELAEFESSYSEYWNSIHSPVPTDWVEKRDRMEMALVNLESWTDRERKRNEERALALSTSERSKVNVTTLAAIVVGFLVAGLTFYEIRRILDRLGRAYRQSAESRDYLQSLFDSLVSGVFVVNRDGTIKTVSDSFSRMTGLGREAILDQDYKTLFNGKPHLIENVENQLNSDLPESRYLGRIELGRDRLFDVFSSPLIISEEYRGLILVFTDITETERAQSELRRNRALAAVGEMTAQIAHEIKNPLGSIRFAAELIKRRPMVDDQSRETIEVIDRSVNHLSSIIAELSEFARPKELNRSPTDLNELLDSLAPMLADRLAGKRLQVVRKYNDSLPVGRYDQTELRKLFLNLIINAIDASEQESVIELETKLDGGNSVMVEVVDHGCGMDHETLSRLFEPFYTTKKGGTGLGMAISKKIAELHRGDLHVESRRGKGTKVIVRLPIN